MRLFYSATSPYARIARIALAEKGITGVDERLTDPWDDDPDLLEANPSARVPSVVLDGGLPLTESLLIVLWLETQRPAPSLLGVEPARVLSKAGVAMGAIDAAAAIIIGRKMTDAGFDESPVGLRRRRSVVQALGRLEADPPGDGGGAVDLSMIATVVALDYMRFRFPSAPWLPPLPRLDALAARARDRRSFAATVPRAMPKP
jgi:glutathione S-transferase